MRHYLYYHGLRINHSSGLRAGAHEFQPATMYNGRDATSNRANILWPLAGFVRPIVLASGRTLRTSIKGH